MINKHTENSPQTRAKNSPSTKQRLPGKKFSDTDKYFSEREARSLPRDIGVDRLPSHAKACVDHATAAGAGWAVRLTLTGYS
jgi:hypothetical protein